VPDKHIETALKDSAETSEPALLVRSRIERKLRSFRGELDDRKMASIYRSLIGAGFPSELVRRELKRMTREEVPEVDGETEAE
jgi:SOS response regulatory protein OraA/RecX